MIKLLLWLLLLSACATPASNNRMSMVHTKLGTNHLMAKNFPLAFRELFTAVELDQKNELAHNQLGLTYILANKLPEARVHILTALKLNPKYTDARINYAFMLLENKQYQLALQELDIAASDLTYENKFRISAFRGQAYFLINQYEEARIQLRESIMSNRTYCPAHRFFGPSLTMQADYERAIKAIEHALALCYSENYEELYYYGALAYYHNNDLSRSRAKIKELADAHPNSKFKAEAEKILALIASKE